MKKVQARNKNACKYETKKNRPLIGIHLYKLSLLFLNVEFNLVDLVYYVTSCTGYL